MASISFSPTMVTNSPFDSDLSSPPLSPKSHGRRISRNTNIPPLPIFSFNPGAVEQAVSAENMDADAMFSEQGLDISSTRRNSSRTPLPDFKFNPGADVTSEPLPSPTHPVLQEMALNQQRATRSARPAPLSSFTFPSNPNSAQPSPSPTKSAFGEVPSNARNSVGHRRRGSEFVGNGNDGNVLISGSPDKMEGRLTSPPISGGPRSHAHRRSQAVSISDIETSDLIKASAMAKTRAGSTPTTPSDPTQQFLFGRSTPPSRHSISYRATSPSSPSRGSSAHGVRPRVGFADHVDVIPRPLSLISSETEGSNSTIRCGHSLSGSVNSIASPSPRRISHVRASTAPGNPQERLRNSDLSNLSLSDVPPADDSLTSLDIPNRPLSASESPSTLSESPPNKKKHFWSSHSADTSQISTPEKENTDPLAAVPAFLPTPVTEPTRPRTSPERTASIKKRKYHTWTSGIFSKKAGKRYSKSRPKRIANLELKRPSNDTVNEVFDADDTIVIREPSPIAERRRALPLVIPIAPPTWQNTETENQVTSPVIDLDVALDPFGNEDKLNNDETNRTTTSRIAKLHSSERRGSVDAFGNVHRRTESAPSMPSINRAVVFGFHRIGSNASLTEDVFDEEEEDDFLAGKNNQPIDLELSPKSVPAPIAWKGSKHVSNHSHTKSNDGLGLAMKTQQPDGVVIVDDDADFAHMEDRSSKSTIEAPVFSDQDMMKQPTSPTISFAYPAPRSNYASSTEGRTTSASMISSPDPDVTSFESLPRHVRYLGEPSPDMVLRASNDDLPSLTDSISSGARPRISSSTNTRSSVEHRSNSMFVSPTAKSTQTWKRSSLASLNRLIPGSSNGSKLKFETVPDVLSDEKGKKKTNRLSKLMLFWRSKERGEA